MRLTFTTQIAINLRRYYPEQQKEHIGCHITMHERKCTMTSEGRQDFWSSARKAKATLHEDLTSKNCLKIIPIIKWVSIVFPFNIYRNKKKTCNVTDSHYITTNMGDVTKIIGDRDPEDPVQITDLYRSTNGEQAGHFFTLTCHTFRKRLYVSIDYSANKMTDDLAADFFDGLKEILTDLALKGSVS